MRDTFEKIQHFIATRVETAQEAEEIVKALANVKWEKLVAPKEETSVHDKPISEKATDENPMYRYSRQRNKQQILDAKEARTKELRALPYAEYLKTPEWAAKRDTAMKRAKYRCQVCNTGRHLNVHHRSYENLGCEKFDDLIVLCKGCHETFHRNGKLAKRTPENFTDQF